MAAGAHRTFDFTAFFGAAVVSLSLYTSTFVCEALRSGVNAVPLGQAEAARAIGLPFAGVMSQVVLPQAFRASVPPLASVQIALIKNTSVAAVFGIAEATVRDAQLHQRPPRPTDGLFIAFALGYIVIVEGFSFLAHPSRTPLEGVHMSTSVLFDAPGPARVARHRIYTVVACWHCWLRSPGLSGGCTSRAVRGRHVGGLRHPRLRPGLLVDGLLETLKMAFSAVIARSRLRALFGVGKLSDHAGRWLCWAVVEFFRAVPVLLLMVFYSGLRARRSAH